MSEPTSRPPVSRGELARDLVILAVLHVGCYGLIWREGWRGWEVVWVAPLYGLLTGGLTLFAVGMTLLALRLDRPRWLLAAPPFALLLTALYAAWKAEPEGLAWGAAREGLLLASLTQAWLALIVLGIGAGVGRAR